MTEHRRVATLRLGIGGHQRPGQGRTDDWITPRWLLEALGPFDLDPCACTPQPWPCATRSYTWEDDGLLQEWSDRVWLNPPYGKELGSWLRRLSEHGNGLAIVFARTDTLAFFRWVWPKAAALLFLRGRVQFYQPDGRKGAAGIGGSGGPSVLIAYGSENAERLAACRIAGALVTGWRR